MTNIINILLPEIFLSLSIFLILMLGVFIKNSYKIVTRFSYLVLLLLIFILLANDGEILKIYSDSFVRDSFSMFVKLLIVSFQV